MMINSEMYDKLEKMYIEDVERLKKENDELRKECELWKDRALGAERDRADATRQLRHV